MASFASLLSRVSIKAFCSRRLVVILASLLISFGVIYSVYTYEPQECKDKIPKWREYYLENMAVKQFWCEEKDKLTFTSRISHEELMKELAESPRARCNCELANTSLRNVSMEPGKLYYKSTCSGEATLLGENQNVVSYTVYTKAEMTEEEKQKAMRRHYFFGIQGNLEDVKRYYPGWVMRVYTNYEFGAQVCDLVCSDDLIYFCNIRQEPELEKLDGMVWRTLPLGDPTVKKFISRDLDSRVSERERLAVAEWEDSEFVFHGMRDSEYHNSKIMGGMWGANNEKLCYRNATRIQRDITEIKWTLGGYTDQQLLVKVLYNKYKRYILNHDSYFCGSYKDSLPFPSQRPNNYQFVGQVYVAQQDTRPIKIKCPVKCRPGIGQDWSYC